MKKLIPPFTQETAQAKVKAAENAWNTKNPEKVAQAYTKDTKWRNRNLFFTGRSKVIDFLKYKWEHETHYKLRKHLWSFTDNRISVRFEYEWLDEKNNQWKRTHGNEHWEFNNDGLMKIRDMSANDIDITKNERKFK